MIKVGIIGTGNMGMLHAGLLRKNSEAQLVGMADQDAARARAAAERFGCRGYSSGEELMNSGLDLVFITVPNTAHGALAKQALERGLHVFVEKPLATKLAEARALRALQKSCGKQVFVGLNRRFAPVYQQARALIQQSGFCAQNINIIQNDGDMANPPWLTDLSMTGGFMYDTTVHFLDMACYLLGEIAELRALGKASFYPIIDNFVVQLTFASGAYGVITSCGHASWISPFERVQVTGDHTSVITEELDTLTYAPGLGEIIESTHYGVLEHNRKWGYQEMHRHIFHCLRTGETPLNGVEEGCRVVELIEACYTSARENGRVMQVSGGVI